MNGVAAPTLADSDLNISGPPVSAQQFSIFTVATARLGGSADNFRKILCNGSGANSVSSVFLGTVGDSSASPPSTTVGALTPRDLLRSDGQVRSQGGAGGAGEFLARRAHRGDPLPGRKIPGHRAAVRAR